MPPFPRLAACCRPLFLAGLLLAAGLAPTPTRAGWDWLNPELLRIEEERRTLEEKLAPLPAAPEQEITQRLGWHSDYSSAPDTIEWVELTLGHAEHLDAIVLVAPPPGGGTTESGYGFPVRFRVEILGDDEKTERRVIADHSRQDFPNPGSLPIFIPVNEGGLVHKVRVTATRLYRKNDRYLCALGEIMLLQGPRNLGAALEFIGPNAVHASSSQGTRPDWGRINVVDGQTVLGPPLGPRPSPAFGFRSKPASESHARLNPWVSVDLGSLMPIEEVRLFPTHPPQFAHSHGYGFPVRYQIELRASADAPPEVLLEPQAGSYSALPGDNVVTVVANNRRARYVRLAVLEPHVSNGAALLAMAEMQVWANGKNVAAGQPVSASDSRIEPGWSEAALTDGYASSAEIVDWPAWLAGLSERREVEQALAVLEIRRAAAAQRWQRIVLLSLAGLIGLAVVVVALWLFRQRRERRAEMEALRQRIARDLHDEIGSSLGSISLIAQDILEAEANAAEAREDLIEIKDIADETVSAMRDITRLIQSDRYGTDDLATLLRETAARQLHGVPHTVTVEGVPHAERLPVDRQRDLILMFKETLHNIARHADATSVEIRLAQAAGEITLTVRDDGCGFVPATGGPNDVGAKDSGEAAGTGMGLTNLQRRSAKHGGSVEITSAPTQGTTVCIRLPQDDE